MQTRFLFGLALVGLALLPPVRPMPTILPAEAEQHAGSHVILEGMVVANQRFRDGATRITVVADGHALDIHLDGPADAGRGQWIEARGVLLHGASGLRLIANQLTVASAPQPSGWDDLASVEEGDPVRLRGTIEHGALHHGSQRVALGDGPWPASGIAEGEGTLSYHPSCMCHRFHADRVWTS